MNANEIPASYRALFKLLTTTGEALTELLERLFKEAGEPFDRQTAHFEVDIYVAFRMSCCLQRNPRAWDDLAMLFMLGVVGTHRKAVRSDDLNKVFEQRVGTYGQCWNACVDSKKYPALSCLQMLRMHIIGSTRRGRVDTNAPLDITEGFMAEMMVTPALVELDSQVVGKLDCMLKHVMRLGEDLSSMTEEQVLMAAARGADEANEILGHSRGDQSVQEQLRRAMNAMKTQSAVEPRTQRKRWWQFWM